MKFVKLALGAALLALAANALALGSLAEVSIYDRKAGRTLPVYYSEGRYYVAGTPGTEYQINVYNRGHGDLLAVVSVDGVNVITGETASPDQSGYVISPWRTLDIKGWRKSLERIAGFYFSRIEDSYAARTGRPGNVGVIGVALFKRKVEPPVQLYEPKPWQEKRQEEGWHDGRDDGSSGEGGRRANSGDAASGAGANRLPAPPAAEKAEPQQRLGTGHGRSETSQARYTSFERESERPNETLTIYYDSYRNLVARGVIPPERRDIRPYDPQPFPSGFVADPPRRS